MTAYDGSGATRKFPNLLLLPNLHVTMYDYVSGNILRKIMANSMILFDRLLLFLLPPDLFILLLTFLLPILPLPLLRLRMLWALTVVWGLR